MNSTLNDNLLRIKDQIGAAAKKSGRTADDVQLVAVTKYLDVDATEFLVEIGQTTLGESRPQALWSKAERLAEYPIEWHLIGHLQRNKVNRTVPLCSLIHSVDSTRLLDALDTASQTANLVTRCLLEVNISGESAKHGLPPDEVEPVLEHAAHLKGIRVEGLMGMGSLGGGAEQNRSEFASLRQLGDRLSLFQAENVALRELSMGMSVDFETAIEEGATIVRIGSILFEGWHFG